MKKEPNYREYLDRILKARKEYVFDGKQPELKKIWPSTYISSIMVYGLISKTNMPTLEQVRVALDLSYAYKNKCIRIDPESNDVYDGPSIFDRSINDYSDDELLAEVNARGIGTYRMVDSEQLDKDNVCTLFRLTFLEMVRENPETALDYIACLLQDNGYTGNISYNKKKEF